MWWKTFLFIGIGQFLVGAALADEQRMGGAVLGCLFAWLIFEAVSGARRLAGGLLRRRGRRPVPYW